MKLVLCERCWDVFKLSFEMRRCSCGEVEGRYLDNSRAEVSANAISLALGNGALENAIRRMRSLKEGTQNLADREQYIGAAKIDYAWVRPNEGLGNPHCKVIKKAAA